MLVDRRAALREVPGYGVEAETFVDKMWGQLIDEPSESPSERLYQDLLPDVPPGKDSVNLDASHERALAEAGYIIGELQRVIFYEPGVKETNWSATAPVSDEQGVLHRWVYLHYFKEGQPSINWLDPTSI